MWVCLCENVRKLPSWCEQYAHCTCTSATSALHIAVACAQCTMLKSVISNVELSPMTTLRHTVQPGHKWKAGRVEEVCKSKLYFQARTTILFISFEPVDLLYVWSGFPFVFHCELNRCEQNDAMMFAYVGVVQNEQIWSGKKWIEIPYALARMLLYEHTPPHNNGCCRKSERVREKIRLVGCSIN